MAGLSCRRLCGQRSRQLLRIGGSQSVCPWHFPLCNTAEVLLCAAMLRLRLGRALDLTRGADLGAFAAVSIIGPASSAILAATILSVNWGCFRRGMAALDPGRRAGPPDLRAATSGSTARGDAALLRPRTAARAGALLLLVAAVTVAVFAQSRYPALFAIFPALVLVAFLLGNAGAVPATSDRGHRLDRAVGVGRTWARSPPTPAAGAEQLLAAPGFPAGGGVGHTSRWPWRWPSGSGWCGRSRRPASTSMLRWRGWRTACSCSIRTTGSSCATPAAGSCCPRWPISLSPAPTIGISSAPAWHVANMPRHRSRRRHRRNGSPAHLAARGYELELNDGRWLEVVGRRPPGGRHREPPARYHRVQAGGRGADRGAGQGRGGGPGEVRVPGHHEPRDQDADDRDPGHGRPSRRRRPAAARSAPSGRHPRLRPTAPGGDQRCARRLPDRGRDRPARDRRLRYPSPGRGGRVDPVPAGGRARSCLRLRASG